MMVKKLGTIGNVLLILISLFLIGFVSAGDVSESCMVSCWGFENNYEDSVGDNDGTPFGSQGFVDGPIGRAIDFGSTSGVSVGNSADLNPDAMSVEFWVNGAGTGTLGALFSRYHSLTLPYWAYRIGMNSNGVQLNSYGNQEGSVGAYVPISGSDEWHHVAITYDDRDVEVYVDGALESSGTIPYYMPKSVLATIIGNNYPGQYGMGYFTGKMDEVAFYDCAISSEEILNHYEDGLEGKSYCEVEESSCVSYTETYDFGGMFSTDVVNVATGEKSCPDGYSEGLMYASGPDGYSYKTVKSCYREHEEGRDSLYDYGGVYGKKGVRKANDITGDTTCPDGYDSSTLNYITYCYRPHVETEYSFGGSYVQAYYGETGNAVMNYAKRTCPEGYSKDAVFGQVNVYVALVMCYAEVCDVEPFCGDGDVDYGEECDGGDGCSSSCEIEPPVCVPSTEICNFIDDDCDGEVDEGDVCYVGPVCGNNVLEVGEGCDDGNIVNGDGCSASCAIESLNPVCGNSLLEVGEGCDDGNLVSGDGCSDVCVVEPPVCVVDLVNSSWSSWEDEGLCVNDLKMQSRYLTLYDFNSCGLVLNETLSETNEVNCSVSCVSDLVNGSWGSWEDYGSCSSGTQDLRRSMVQSDLGGCVGDETFYGYDDENCGGKSGPRKKNNGNCGDLYCDVFLGESKLNCAIDCDDSFKKTMIQILGFGGNSSGIIALSSSEDSWSLAWWVFVIALILVIFVLVVLILRILL